jgi:uncharacterized protein (DUF305 family)
MSENPRHFGSKMFPMSVCAVTFAVAALTLAPTYATAGERITGDTPSVASATTHNAKMNSPSGAPCSNETQGTQGTRALDGTSASASGNVDYDFAANMRNHHQRAVEMAQAQLINGTNPAMRGMANEIIATQNQEIITLDQWLATHRSSAKAPN